MSTFRRVAALAAVLVAAACSSPITGADKIRTPEAQPNHNAAADSSANRGGGNLMGGN